MASYQGMPPTTSADDVERQKHLEARVTEVRKSCETVAGWCLASIIASSIRAGATPNKAAIVVGVLGVALGVYGSTLTGARVDKAQSTAHLERRLKVRSRCRHGALVALGLGLSLLLYDVLLAAAVGIR